MSGYRYVNQLTKSKSYEQLNFLYLQNNGFMQQLHRINFIGVLECILKVLLQI